MSKESTKTFSVAELINTVTKEKFGEAYAGNFTVRKPTMGDMMEVSAKQAAFFGKHNIDPDNISESYGPLYVRLSTFTYVEVLCSEVPEWFGRDALDPYNDNDVQAVYAVWGEVNAFLGTFRPDKDSPESGDAGDKS